MTVTAEATKAPDAEQLRLRVGGAYACGQLSESHVLALAAAAASDSHDPVDEALANGLIEQRPDVDRPLVDPADVDPASRQRRFSLTRVRHLRLEEGMDRDVVVMRGNLEDVMGKVDLKRADKALIRRNANYASARGWRQLAVASAVVGADDRVGPFRFQGFVNIGGQKAGQRTDSGPGNWVRVSVWPATLRVQHWVNVFAILILSCTGYYIMDPFFGTSTPGDQAHFFMGYVRLIHFTTAFIWLLLGLTRIVVAFTSREPTMRWSTLWPLKRKGDWGNLGHQLQHYALIKNNEPLYIGHNPLQQLGYSALYVVALFQMCTGLVLFSLFHQGSPVWQFIGTPIHWFGIPFFRLLHVALMFVIWFFVILHVYLGFRADSMEKRGTISAMINGGVWMRVGAQPVDSHIIG